MLCILFPLFLFSFILKYSTRFTETEISSRFNVLYSQYDISKEYYFSGILLFIIRRLIFGVSILILGQSPYIQISINSACCAGIILSYICYNPFKTRKDRYIEIFAETCIFISMNCLVVSMFNIANPDAIDWVLVIALYGSILIPSIVNLILVIRDLYLRCKGNKDTEPIPYSEQSTLPKEKLTSP